MAAEIQKYAVNADVSFQLVRGASHQVLWDQPERSGQLLREFAGSLGLSTATPPDRT